jgi:kynureninase
MRFGFTPLFLDEDDVVAAAAVLERVIADGLYREARFQNRAKVT